jgi:hypothetical protein
MSTLEFFPKSLFSMRRYTLTRAGVEIGQIDCGGVRQPASLIVDGASYNPVREGVLRTKFHLDAGTGGARIADIEPAGASFRRFSVHANGKTYTLKAASWLGWAFALIDGDAEVGRIARTGFFSTRSKAEFSDDLPLPIQAFLIWLVLITWRRQVVVNSIMAGTVAASSQ